MKQYVDTVEMVCISSAIPPWIALGESKVLVTSFLTNVCHLCWTRDTSLMVPNQYIFISLYSKLKLPA